MKKGNSSYLLLIFLLFFFLSCQTEIKKPNIESTLLKLIDKFPQLPRGKGKQSDFYKHVRTVLIGESKIQLQLWSTPDSIEDKQQIVIIINTNGKYYAIPFLSNIFRDYWEFQFDNLIPSVKKTNSTFKHEFASAITYLNLKDSIGTEGKVINEMLVSLINCEKVTENDSSHFLGLSLKNCNVLPEENVDSCFLRLQRNFGAIKKEIHPQPYFYNYNAYWDRKNDRVYQVNYGKHNLNHNQKTKFDLKTYRQDCIFHFLEM